MAKIMVVDDSETVRIEVKKAIESGGHSVVEAFDGVNGLEVLGKNTDVALIICDVNMPNMDGIAMCQKVHANPQTGKIPIFMLTTEASPEMKAKGKEAGVIAWITKPFVQDKLLAAINKVAAGT
jgi:two-component system chemotaxis response regulator CheY